MSPRRNRAAAPRQRTMTADAVCRSASHVPVVDAISRLGPITGPGQILDQSGADPAAQLAGEQTSHLVESWQYMGAAIRAVLCNASDNAVHFAYYAQLRAVLSVFAGSGIRVRLGKNFYLDAQGNRHAFVLPNGDRTHPVTWSLWDEWVKTTYAQELMQRRISLVAGIALGDIALVPSGSGALMSAWGYDLACGLADHTARNQASYHAKATSPSPVMTNSHLSLVERMWTLLLQNGEGVLFDATLVRYFVDRFVADAIEQSRGDARPADRASLLARVANMTEARTGVASGTLLQVLDAEVDTGLFEVAAARSTKVENVVSRALFLVRIATLAQSATLTDGAGPDAKRWLAAWLSSAGLYDPQVHDGPSDIAVDYEDALEEFHAADWSRAPASLWGSSARNTALLSRPEGFMGWALPL